MINNGCTTVSLQNKESNRNKIWYLAATIYDRWDKHDTQRHRGLRFPQKRWTQKPRVKWSWIMTHFESRYMFLDIKHNNFYSMPHIPALWYFDTSVTYPQWFRRVKYVVIPPRFLSQQYLWNIAIHPAVGCFNSWANSRCSGCSPLGGCETGLLIHNSPYQQ